MTTIRMESGGPWYPPIVMAHALLGRRAMQAKKINYPTVKAQIETKLRPELEANGKEFAPTLRTVRNWGKAHPDYPEWALKNGLIQEADLLPWALDYLNAPKRKTKRRVGSKRLPKIQYNPNVALANPIQ